MSDQGGADAAGGDPSGWSVPGEGTVGDDPAQLQFGRSPAFGGSAPSGPLPGATPPGATPPGSTPPGTTPPGAPPFSTSPPPTWAPPPGGGPARPEPKRTPPTVLALVLLVVVVVIGLGAWFTRWIDGRDDVSGYDASGYDAYFGGESVATSVASPAPAVVVPPADAAASTTAIVELYVKVFTPGQSDELWDSLISDPGNLREQIRPFGQSDCAVGVETVVTAVQFTGDDTADVTFRFQGPNIPEFGTSYLFSGGAVRQPDGSWKATPEGVQQVASLASGYCS